MSSSTLFCDSISSFSSCSTYSSPIYPLTFVIEKHKRRYRAGRMILPHGEVKTPMFMPVGTYGVIKGLSSKQMEDLSCEIILSNTYHLYMRPGLEVMEEAGGLHKFMNWKKNILTDSGGFQMVSLSKLTEVSEEGVTFASHLHQNEKILLTPEMSIKMQNAIGSDIMMALDDVVSAKNVERKRFEEATHRTTRWLERCINSNNKKDKQNLFGIVQGGLYDDLRQISISDLKRFDLPGYAIGGLSGGESKDKFWRVVEQTTREETGLPWEKPRYLMGVGYALDIVVCIVMGCDIFDCVYPCRTARFGTALVNANQGVMRLRKEKFKFDHRPIDEECDCYTCKNYSRSYLYRIVSRTATGSSLLTIHNIRYMMNLCKSIRNAILNDSFEKWIENFMIKLYPPMNATKIPRHLHSTNGFSVEVEHKGEEQQTDNISNCCKVNANSAIIYNKDEPETTLGNKNTSKSQAEKCNNSPLIIRCEEINFPEKHKNKNVSKTSENIQLEKNGHTENKIAVIIPESKRTQKALNKKTCREDFNYSGDVEQEYISNPPTWALQAFKYVGIDLAHLYPHISF